jgi:imidazolonepropionase-like amidohydrolase
VDKQTGSITIGKNADLVLLQGNPLEDISAVRRAELVITRGRLYKPAELFAAVGVKPFLE